MDRVTATQYAGILTFVIIVFKKLSLTILEALIKQPSQPGWWHRHIILELLIQSQGAYEFQAGLVYTANTVRVREMERGEEQRDRDREGWGRKSFF